jgi:hypothetical protein
LLRLALPKDALEASQKKIQAAAFLSIASASGVEKRSIDLGVVQ